MGRGHCCNGDRHLIIWWITVPGGPLVPALPQEKPVPEILDFSATDISDGERSSGNFRVYNDGAVPAGHCTIWWYSGSEVGKQLEKGLLPRQSAVSPGFGLTSKETREVTLMSLQYTEPGTFHSAAHLECIKGSDPAAYTPTEFEKTVTVFSRYEGKNGSAQFRGSCKKNISEVEGLLADQQIE